MIYRGKGVIITPKMADIIRKLNNMDSKLLPKKFYHKPSIQSYIR